MRLIVMRRIKTRAALFRAAVRSRLCRRPQPPVPPSAAACAAARNACAPSGAGLPAFLLPPIPP
ncbi:hypothetical protein, partial [Neisseria gonorrhoeae]|uniref:hypothetical protein n=1 Tax=Neisseria gonorrhoeae TaxID=485 RepID=UPI001C58CBF1